VAIRDLRRNPMRVAGAQDKAPANRPVLGLRRGPPDSIKARGCLWLSATGRGVCCRHPVAWYCSSGAGYCECHGTVLNVRALREKSKVIATKMRRDGVPDDQWSTVIQMRGGKTEGELKAMLRAARGACGAAMARMGRR